MVAVFNPNIYAEKRKLAAEGRYISISKGDEKEICVIGFWKNSKGVLYPVTDFIPDDKADAYKKKNKGTVLLKDISAKNCEKLCLYKEVKDYTTYQELLAYANNSVLSNGNDEPYMV